MPTRNEHVVRYAAGYDNQPHIMAVFDDHAHQAAVDAHPERRGLAENVQTADARLDEAWRELTDTHRRHARQLSRYGALGHTDDPDAHLARLGRDVAATRGELDSARQQIGQLSVEPAVRVLAAGRLAHEHDLWRAGYDGQRQSERQHARLAAMRADERQLPRFDADLGHQRQIDLGNDFGRDTGPSMGR